MIEPDILVEFLMILLACLISLGKICLGNRRIREQRMITVITGLTDTHLDYLHRDDAGVVYTQVLEGVDGVVALSPVVGRHLIHHVLYLFHRRVVCPSWSSAHWRSATGGAVKSAGEIKKHMYAK